VIAAGLFATEVAPTPLFGGIASLAGIVALVAFLLGGNFVPAMLVAIVSAIIAANIKYKLVKQVEVGGYKLQ